MKVFKLAKAELKKIFLRPVMLLVYLLLIASILLLSLNFDPQKRLETAVYVNKTGQVQTVYNNFLKESDANSKSNFDKILTSQTQEIETFFNNFKTDDNGQINQIKIKILQIKEKIAQIHSAIVYYNQIKASPTSSQQQIEAARNAVVLSFQTVNTSAAQARAYLQTIHTEGLTFFITEEQYKTLDSFLKNLEQTVPESFPVKNNDVEVFMQNYNFLTTNFDFNLPAQVIENLKYFKISKQNFNPLLDKYSYNVLDTSNLQNTTPTLNNLFSKIKTFMQENAESTDLAHLNQMQTYISQYKSIAVMNATVLKNEFELAKASGVTDFDVRDYMGFLDFHSYNLKQTSTQNKYLLENNLYDYEYLNPFSFNQNSGQTTNAFDFVVYSMQIISLIIAVFSIFIASGTVANEQASGTMKMLAIRPYSRGKIITAKLLSVTYFMFIVLLMSFFATFTVGYISYGIPQTQSLLIFNAEFVIIVNSFLALLLYFASVFLNMLFFISVALLISVLAKSNTVAVILTVLLYALAVIGKTMLASAKWFALTPIAHLDIFRFFGTTNSDQLFGLSFPLNSNFFTSITYLLSSILVCFIVSASVFKKRNIA